MVSQGQFDPTLERLEAAIGDRYQVIERIGGGGAGDVYLARHRLHGGFCAVKVLSPQLAREPSLVARFLEEARTAAALEGHPNIIRIVDIGEAQGVYYLLMPYIDGEDLGAYLARNGRLSPQEAAYVVRQVAEALVWSHGQGVVHRDLKPSNVRLDTQGRITVLDFGIAKAAGAGALTQTGQTLGTPYYMSPEQIRGEAVDARTDLYSLGVMFYELLTGGRPFLGETHRAIEQAHLTQPAPAPREANPDVPGEMSEVAHKLLEKDAEKRYRSAQEFLFVLSDWAPERPPPSLRAAPDTLLARYRGRPVDPPSEAFTPQRPRVAPPAPPVEEPAAGDSKVFLAIVGFLVATALGAALYVALGDREAVASSPDPPAPAVALPAPEAAPPHVEGMVYVPGGEFGAGDADENAPAPPRTLFVAGFHIDRTEASNAEYRAFCDATGRAAPEPAPWDEEYFTAKPDYPVINVTFEDAEAFCRWAGKRLPTEQEWEKAARGEDRRPYPWGLDPPSRQANHEGLDDGYAETAPVDALAAGAGPYGALNLAGNVWEWTATPYPASPQEIADMRSLVRETGGGWRVLKGGSFVTPREDPDLRAYMRAGMPAAAYNPSIGFRCVQDAD